MNPSLGYHTIGWHHELPETIRRIKELGCDGVEFYDLAEFMEMDDLAEKVEVALHETGLQVAGTFFGASLVEKDRRQAEFKYFRKSARMIRRLGGSYIILGGGRVRAGREQQDRLTLYDSIHELSTIAGEEGVSLLFHPHEGTLVFSRDEIASFAEHVEAKVAPFTFDTAHLLLSDTNPIPLFREYISRIAYVHLKDLRAGAFVELGEGQVYLPGVFQVLREKHYDGWLVVELDESADPDASAQISMTYLREKLLVGA